MGKQAPVEVTGIWLVRNGGENDPYAKIVVLAEIDGEWREVITEPVGNYFSHIVEPAGMRLATAPLWLTSTPPKEAD